MNSNPISHECGDAIVLREAVFDADDARHRAMMAHDLVALESLLAPELIYTHATARRETRNQYLGSLINGRVRYQGVRRLGADVTVYADAAVMTGRSEIRAISEGTLRVVENMFQSVWIKRGPCWQMAAWTSVLIPGTGIPGENSPPAGNAQ